MIQFIEVLRAIATAMIANSHFKGVYPTDLLSFGGGFGLTLFYMISGFCLANIQATTKIKSWYLKKVVRLYIPLIILKLIEMLVGYLNVNTIEQFVREFIFPASWFGASMLLMYLLYYCIVKELYRKIGIGVIRWIHVIDLSFFLLMFATKSSIGMFSLETLVVADKFGIETPYIILLPIWMSSMLIGFEIRKEYDAPNKSKNDKKIWLYGSGIIMSMILFYAVKIFEKRDEGTVCIIVFPIIYICFAYTMFRLCMIQEEKFKRVPDNACKKIVGIISACSLEIYYIQFPWIHLFKDYIFPINWILIVFITVISAYLLHYVSGTVFYALVKKKVGK